MDAIVIGAGLAGLVAANDLADAGAAVTVVEARGSAGGRAATDEKEGFLLNQGAHALYLGGATARILASLGVEARGGVPPTRGTLALVGDEFELFPVGPASLVRTRVLPRAAKAEFGRLLAGVRRVRPEALAHMSISEWLESELRREESRAVARAVVRLTTYVADLDRLSADAALAQVQLALGPGVLYLDGGWATLVDALAARAVARGAELQPGTAALGVARANGRWIVSTRAGDLAADAVVVAAGRPETAARLLGELAPPWTFGPRAEAAVLDLGLERLPYPDRRFALGIDRPVSFSLQAPPARLGRRGVLVTVMGYRDPADPGFGTREDLERVADVVQPGWRDALLVERYLPRMIPISALPVPEAGGRAGRPTAAVSGWPNLAVAGDWVGPTGLLADAAVASGRAAAASIAGAVCAAA